LSAHARDDERPPRHWIKEVSGVVAVESDDELDRLTKQEFAKLEQKLGTTDDSGNNNNNDKEASSVA
jgi:hypothetical protein